MVLVLKATLGSGRPLSTLLHSQVKRRFLSCDGAFKCAAYIAIEALKRSTVTSVPSKASNSTTANSVVARAPAQAMSPSLPVGCH